ncbi:hypothetical protein BC937DRAFT_92811 [Endogone sp. FLAS-F59071]|nr:hypothetical protein BC937DRAFT_92811 [Endogone sp. FLAS-F59071]|eukprot:RUS21395.1 hypothetical protein BC937DRAFT_92811 [Endogone sp. FLAS-F59071]
MGKHALSNSCHQDSKTKNKSHSRRDTEDSDALHNQIVQLNQELDDKNETIFALESANCDLNRITAELDFKNKTMVFMQDTLVKLRTGKDYSRFTCVVCTEILAMPHTICCGHTLCFGCLREWLPIRRECPTCRKHVTRRPILSFAIRDQIDLFIQMLPEGEREETQKRLVARVREIKERFMPSSADQQELDPWNGLFKKMDRFITDDEDGVRRCELCAWELVGHTCVRCGAEYLGENESDVAIEQVDVIDLSDEVDSGDEELSEDEGSLASFVVYLDHEHSDHEMGLLNRVHGTEEINITEEVDHWWYEPHGSRGSRNDQQGGLGRSDPYYSSDGESFQHSNHSSDVEEMDTEDDELPVMSRASLQRRLRGGNITTVPLFLRRRRILESDTSDIVENGMISESSALESNHVNREEGSSDQEISSSTSVEVRQTGWMVCSSIDRESDAYCSIKSGEDDDDGDDEEEEEQREENDGTPLSERSSFTILSPAPNTGKTVSKLPPVRMERNNVAARKRGRRIVEDSESDPESDGYSKIDERNQIRWSGRPENRNEMQLAACVDTNGNNIQDASWNYHDGDARGSSGYRDLCGGSQSRVNLNAVPHGRGGGGGKNGRKARSLSCT